MGETVQVTGDRKSRTRSGYSSSIHRHSVAHAENQRKQSSHLQSRQDERTPVHHDNPRMEDGPQDSIWQLPVGSFEDAPSGEGMLSPLHARGSRSCPPASTSRREVSQELHYPQHPYHSYLYPHPPPQRGDYRQYSHYPHPPHNRHAGYHTSTPGEPYQWTPAAPTSSLTAEKEEEPMDLSTPVKTRKTSDSVFRGPTLEDSPAEDPLNSSFSFPGLDDSFLATPGRFLANTPGRFLAATPARDREPFTPLNQVTHDSPFLKFLKDFPTTDQKQKPSTSLPKEDARPRPQMLALHDHEDKVALSPRPTRNQSVLRTSPVVTTALPKEPVTAETEPRCLWGPPSVRLRRSSNPRMRIELGVGHASQRSLERLNSRMRSDISTPKTSSGITSSQVKHSTVPEGTRSKSEVPPPPPPPQQPEVAAQPPQRPEVTARSTRTSADHPPHHRRSDSSSSSKASTSGHHRQPSNPSTSVPPLPPYHLPPHHAHHAPHHAHYYHYPSAAQHHHHHQYPYPHHRPHHHPDSQPMITPAKTHQQQQPPPQSTQPKTQQQQPVPHSSTNPSSSSASSRPSPITAPKIQPPTPSENTTTQHNQNTPQFATAPQITPKITKGKKKEEDGRPPPCKCKKSKCLKLYCDCFGVNAFCQGCRCVDCHNVPGMEEEREKAMREIRHKNPHAFKPRVDAAPTTLSAQHNMGCKCSRTGCLKKYCECFKGGILCGEKCKCQGCNNLAGSQKLIDARRRMRDDEGAQFAMKAAHQVWKGQHGVQPPAQHQQPPSQATPTQHRPYYMCPPPQYPYIPPEAYLDPRYQQHPGSYSRYQRAALALATPSTGKLTPSPVLARRPPPLPTPPADPADTSPLGVSGGIPPIRKRSAHSTSNGVAPGAGADAAGANKRRRNEPRYTYFGPRLPGVTKTTTVRIFSFLDRSVDLAQVALVCRAWNHVTRDTRLWQTSSSPKS